VHFDPASDVENYVHRSGRTGRTGNPGAVVSFVPNELQREVRSLQRALGFPLEQPAPFADAPAVTSTSSRRPAAGNRPAATSTSTSSRRPAAGSRPTAAATSTSSRRPAAGNRPVARPRSIAPRLSGTVKFFDAKRGYGFLTVPGGAEVYVHQSKVQAGGNGPRALRKGQRVDFELAAGRAGEEAHNVTVAREMAS
jgi:CspA family cold shock protein